MLAISVKAVGGTQGGIGVRIPQRRALFHTRMRHQYTRVHAQSSGDDGGSSRDEKDVSALVRERGFSRLRQPLNSETNRSSVITTCIYVNL